MSVPSIAARKLRSSQFFSSFLPTTDLWCASLQPSGCKVMQASSMSMEAANRKVCNGVPRSTNLRVINFHEAWVRLHGFELGGRSIERSLFWINLPRPSALEAIDKPAILHTTFVSTTILLRLVRCEENLEKIFHEILFSLDMQVGGGWYNQVVLCLGQRLLVTRLPGVYGYGRQTEWCLWRDLKVDRSRRVQVHPWFLVLYIS